jgi:hypothetical protein
MMGNAAATCAERAELGEKNASHARIGEARLERSKICDLSQRGP